MYNEELMDHYRFPRNREVLERPDFESAHENPSCGDKIILQGMRDGDVITKLCFSGVGCVISQAVASQLTEYVAGKTVKEIESITHQTITDMVGMPLGPVRLKCALLSLDALRKALS